MPRSKAMPVVLSLATAFVSATAWAQSTNRAVPGAVPGAIPGSLTFAQGQVNVDGQPLQSGITPAVPPKQLGAGETLSTANGSAEVLLAPGALLRLGQNTAVQMVAEQADRTEVRLQQGVINVNVNAVSRGRLLLIDLPHGQTQIVSPGLYALSDADNTLRVFNGEARLFPGADTDTDVKPIKVKEGHEVIVGGDRARPEKFDRELAESDLLPWNGPHAIGKPLPDSVFNYGSAAGFDGATYTGLGFGGGGYGFGGIGLGFGYPGFYPGGFGFYGPYGFGNPYAFGGYGYGPLGFGGYSYGGYGYGGGYYGGGYYGGSGGYLTGSGVRRFPPLKGPGRLAPNGGSNGFAGNGTNGLRGGGNSAGSFRGGVPSGGGGFRGGAPMGAGGMRSGGGFGGGAPMGAGGMRGGGGGFGGGGGGARGGGGGGHR